MSLKSINDIAQDFGISPRTVKKLAEAKQLKATKGGKTGRALLYESVEIHEALNEKNGSDGKLDLTKERARLAHHQANKTALEEDVLRGNLLHANQVVEDWSAMVAACRAKLLALPQRIAQIAIAGNSLREIEENVKTEIYGALEELAQAEYMEEGHAGLESAAGANNIGMGGT